MPDTDSRLSWEMPARASPLDWSKDAQCLLSATFAELLPKLIPEARARTHDRHLHTVWRPMSPVTDLDRPARLVTTDLARRSSGASSATSSSGTTAALPFPHPVVGMQTALRHRDGREELHLRTCVRRGDGSLEQGPAT